MGPSNMQQMTMRYLNDILSQSGPSALPYKEEMKWTIRQQLCHLLDAFPGLKVKPTHHTNNDGSSLNLLLLDGTIPILFQGVKYNIPINIWLPETFPETVPLVYVTPTKDMIIKPRHNNVDSSGIVRVPYLLEWSSTSSTLADLVQILCAVFSEEPPLFARPPSFGEPQRVNPRPEPRFSSVFFSDSPSASASGIRPGQGVGARQDTRVRQNNVDDAEVAARRELMNKLTERIQNDLSLHQQIVGKEIDKSLAIMQEMSKKFPEMERMEREAAHEEEALEQQLQLIRTNGDILQEWLGRNGKGQITEPSESLFLPADVWSKQLLDAYASDFAVDDAIEALDAAIQEDYTGRTVLPMEVYLKQVRALSKEQFFQRALVLKIKASQNKARVDTMASRRSFSSRTGALGSLG